MRKLALLFILIIPLQAQPQIITTIAGTGSSGTTGNGGAATAASFNYPENVVTDGSGNIYFTEINNNLVRKINSAGIIFTIAGTGTAGSAGDGGPATAAQLNGPCGISSDDTGNIYIAELYGQRVRKINTSDIITTVAGNGTGAYGGDGGPATAAQVWSPVFTCTDHHGNLYISDNQNQRIREVNNLGIITTYVGNGTGGYSGDNGPATAAEIKYPGGIRMDNSGNLFIADDNNCIRKVSPSGIITTFAGTTVAGYSGDGGPATAAQINAQPLGVCVDAAGNLYFSDEINYRVREVNTSGIITTVVGNGTMGFSGDGGPATAAMINYVHGIFIGASGNLYLCDGGNYRLRKIIYPAVATFSPAIDTICEGSCITFTNTSTGSIDSTVWSFGSGVISINPPGDTISACYLVPGIDTVKLYTYNADGVDSTSSIVTVNPTPSAITGSTYICTNTPPYSITLSDATTGGIWSSSDTGLAVVGSTTGIVTAVTDFLSPLDTVTITYSLSTGCYVTRSVILAICEGVPVVSGYNDKIALFPNPATSSLTIKSTKTITTITMTNIVGQTVYMNESNLPQVQVDVADLPTGIYFVKVNNTEVGKFVKE